MCEEGGACRDGAVQRWCGRKCRDGAGVGAGIVRGSGGGGAGVAQKWCRNGAMVVQEWCEAAIFQDKAIKLAET